MPTTPQDETRWSRILEGDRAHLVERYRDPVHRWFRARLPDDAMAEDATQDFFVRLFEKDALSGVDPRRGKFRSFLFAAARNALADLHRTRLAAKKGGGRRHDPLQEESAPPAAADSPEEEFDRLWFLSLVERARKHVKEHAAKSGKREFYRAFRLFYFEGSSGKHLPIEAIAERMAMSVAEVNNCLRRARAAYGRSVREQVAEYSSDREDYEAEMQALAAFLDRQRLHAPPPDSDAPS